MGKIRYCKQCGHALTEESRFCENCGTPVAAPETRQDPAQQVFTPRRPQRPGQPSDRQRAPERREPNGAVRGSEERRDREPNGAVRGSEERRDREPNGAVRGSEERRDQEPRRPDRPVRGSGESRDRGQNIDVRRGGENRDQGADRPANRNEEFARQEQMRRSRYQQEHLGGDWQQSWERELEEEDERQFTPIQYVLLGLIAVLIIALLTFGAFWALGRTRNRDASGRRAGQTEQMQTGSASGVQTDAITILSGDGKTQTDVQTQAAQPETAESASVQTEERATETEAPQTEAPSDITLNYSEFTVTLPASWKGKYGITQNGDEYIFYQQAAKAQGYNGTLFTVAKYKDTSYRELPNYKELGMGGGAAYIFILPTDMQCPSEDEAAVEEYLKLQGDMEQIRSGIRVLVSGEGPQETEAIQILDAADGQNSGEGQQHAQSGSGAYILADSSARTLTDQDVAGMSYDDMQMAINEIYARHGRRFSSTSIQSYFDSQPWYQGTVDADQFDDSVFSAVEGQNIQFLLKKMGIE